VSDHAPTTSPTNRSYACWLCGSGISRHASQPEQPATNGRSWPSTSNSVTPASRSLSGCSARLRLPTACVSCSCAAVGIWIAKRPLASTSARVFVALSSTTVSSGGWKSSAHAHAAAITLSTPSCRAETSTVGPWLSSR